MKDRDTERAQLRSQIVQLRHRTAELEKAESQLEQIEEELQVKDDLYRKLIETMSDGLVIMDGSMRITFVNDSFCKIIGYSRGELIGHLATDFHSEAEQKIFKEQFVRGSKGETNHYEIALTRKDGQEVFVHMAPKPIFTGDGQFKGSFAVVTDITKHKRSEEALLDTTQELELRVQARTADLLHSNEKLNAEIAERKRIEKALKNSEAKWNAMLESIGDHMSMMDKELNIIWANKTAKKIFGDDIVGKKCYEAYHQRKEPCEPYPCLTLRAFEDGKIHEHDTQVEDQDGNTRYFHCTANVALRDEDGQPSAVIEISRDITERKRAEEELRESEQRYSSLFNNNHSVMLLIDPVSAEIIDANPAAAYFYGWSREELTRMKITDINMLSGEQVFQEIERAKSEERHHFFFRHRLANEEIRDVEVYSGPIRLHGKELLYSIIHDISERKQAQNALKQSKELFEKVFISQQDALFIMDAATPPIILDCNPAATKIFGYSREEMLGRKTNFLHIDEKALKEFQDHLYPNLADNGSVHLPEFAMKRKDGTVFPTEHNVMELKEAEGNRIGWVSLVRDISYQKQTEQETKALEAKLLQAKKIEAIANLSGGVAQELDNLFQTVQGYVERLLWDRKKDDPFYQELLDITHAALRGARLTRKLLTFSGAAESKRVPVDLNQEVKQAQKLLNRTMSESIELELHLADDLRIINVDPAQIEQILLALALNARDAMPKGGKITIITESAIVDKELCRTHPEAVPGEYVLLTVADTGHGIGQETLVHVFDPFYTKKDLDDSPGLGLSVVYGIVKNHGGFILCFSESGVGTTFKIYFP
ncbi:MAG: PAS domain S-box protein, partial [Syntrophobacterales bacterium]